MALLMSKEASALGLSNAVFGTEKRETDLANFYLYY